MKRIVVNTISLAVAIFAAAFQVCAQDNALLESDNEAKDLRLDVIRHKMDSIRTNNHRPTVALVLSGGGAKGAAHVGVIKYLENVGIPIDIVMGTSMGGLVGGLYSLGYDSDHLDSLIRGIDWDMALSDKVPREFLSYSTIKYKEKYNVSIPFMYDKESYYLQKEEENQYPHRSEDLHFGADQGDATNLFKDNLLGSLPSGMVYGQNVGNIFSSLTVGFQDDIDFYKDLPIPFLCVATDLVSGKAKVWTEGKMVTALRSTMSIPALFTPVKENGMVLVDGGMVNNYPTDLAKKCGADLVIGVTLSTGYKDYNQINNFGDIASASIDLMGRSSLENNLNIPEVTIKPDLHEYNMLSFDTQSIDVIIGRGYEAAVAKAAELDSLKAVIGGDRTSRQNHQATDIRLDKVRISEVGIIGVSDKESAALMKKINVSAGSQVNSADIDKAVATIFGTNAFDYVNYELLGDEEPYRLHFNCKRGPVNRLGISSRFDTEEVVAMLVNVGLGTLKLQGSSLNFTGKVAINPYADLTYTHISPHGMTINLSSSVRYTDRNNFSIGDNNFKVDFFNARWEAYFSNIKWSRFFMKVGVRDDYYNVGSVMAEQAVSGYDYNKHNNNLLLFVDGRNENLDNAYFPTRGHSVGISYSWLFGGFPTNYNDGHIAAFDAKRVFGGDQVAFIPSVNARMLFGDSSPAPYTNAMGGSLAGRYLYHQMPFIGINNVTAMKRVMAIGRADLRFKLHRNNYITAIYNYAVAADAFDEFDNWGEKVTDFHGMGLQYSYNTIVGPLCFNVHWSDYNHQFGAYLSLGFDF